MTACLHDEGARFIVFCREQLVTSCLQLQQAPLRLLQLGGINVVPHVYSDEHCMLT